MSESELRSGNDARNDNDAERTSDAAQRRDAKQDSLKSTSAMPSDMSPAELWTFCQKQMERADKEKERADNAEAKQAEEKERADSYNNLSHSYNNLSLESYLKAPLQMAINKECMPSIKPNWEARKIVTEYRKKLKEWKKKKLGQEKKKNKRPKVASSKQSKNEQSSPETTLKKPEGYKFHDLAEIRAWKVEERWLNKVQLNFWDGYENRPILHSFFNEHLNPEGDLPLFNETSPQDYVQLCLKDVIKSSGLHRQAAVVKEQSLFAVRPDLLVVMYDGTVVFATEIKNPDQEIDATEIKNPDQERDGEILQSVFTSETAAGQVLVYIEILKQCGVEYPFALLSTYTGTVIVRLGQEGYDNGYEQILNEVAAKVATKGKARNAQAAKQDLTETPAKKPGKKQMPELSPAPKNSLLFSNGQKLESIDGSTNVANKRSAHLDDNDSDNDSDDEDATKNSDKKQDDSFDYRGLKVAYSEILTIENLHKAIGLVLECSIHSIQKIPPSKKMVPDPGSEFGGRYSVIRKDTPTFSILKTCKADYNKPPQFKDDQKFYVLCKVGEGGTGRCILCSSSSGKIFVAKLFLPKASFPQVSPDEKTAIKEKSVLANAEKEKWLILYPKYRAYLNVRIFNQVPSLTMPFFPPIPMDVRERALPKIQECLVSLADKGFYYKEEARWRHFGLRWAKNQSQMEITALDLGSTESLENMAPDKVLTWIRNGMHESDDRDIEFKQLYEQFKMLDQSPSRNKEQPLEVRAKEIKRAINDISPENRVNIQDILNWLQKKGTDDQTNDPTGEFRKIDAILPLYRKKSLLDLAREIEAVQSQMKMLRQRRAEPVPVATPSFLAQKTGPTE